MIQLKVKIDKVRDFVNEDEIKLFEAEAALQHKKGI
jgi:hypothetical protein